MKTKREYSVVTRHRLNYIAAAVKFTVFAESEADAMIEAAKWVAENHNGEQWAIVSITPVKQTSLF